MTPRPIDAIPVAFRHWTKVLWTTFSLKKWCWWTLVAMGAGLGSGGGGGPNCNYRFPISDGGSKRKAADFSQLDEFFGNIDWPGVWDDYKVLILAGAAALALLLLVFMYFAAVLRFVFLDNVVKNEDAVIRPFREFHGRGLSYFFYLLAFTAAALVFIAGPIALMAWRLHQGREPNGAGVILIVLYVLAAVLAAVLADVLAYDFALPAMYLCGTGMLDGWGDFFSVVAAHPLRLAGYVGMKMLLLMALAVPTMIAVIFALLAALVASAVVLVPLGFLVYFTWTWNWLWALAPLGTLWVFALMFVMTAVCLPLVVFSRCYSLAYLETHGERWRVLSAPPPPPPPSLEPAPEDAAKRDFTTADFSSAS